MPWQRESFLHSGRSSCVCGWISRVNYPITTCQSHSEGLEMCRVPRAVCKAQGIYEQHSTIMVCTVHRRPGRGAQGRGPTPLRLALVPLTLAPCPRRDVGLRKDYAWTKPGASSGRGSGARTGGRASWPWPMVCLPSWPRESNLALVCRLQVDDFFFFFFLRTTWILSTLCLYLDTYFLTL